MILKAKLIVNKIKKYMLSNFYLIISSPYAISLNANTISKYNLEIYKIFKY